MDNQNRRVGAALAPPFSDAIDVTERMKDAASRTPTTPIPIKDAASSTPARPTPNYDSASTNRPSQNRGTCMPNPRAHCGGRLVSRPYNLKSHNGRTCASGSRAMKPAAER